MSVSKTVLIAPLNWGLGHAARCVPIIKYLLSQNQKVFIAADGSAFSFLKNEFPNGNFIPLLDAKIKYFAHIPAWLSILVQLPILIRTIRKEKKLIRKIVAEYQIDIIISDNRYGLRTESTTNVLISHQLNANAGCLSFIPNAALHYFIEKFDYCLVPDFQNIQNSLAGKLSHPKKKLNTNIKYINALSRYQNLDLIKTNTIPVLISGPEPLKSRLIKVLISKLEKCTFSFILFCGDTENIESKTLNNIIIKNHDTTQNINKWLCEAPIVIASGGYSSLMDMCCINKKSILIPFQGQTEQEYLAKFHKKSKRFSFVSMKDIENDNFNFQKQIEDALIENEKSTHVDQGCVSQFTSSISQILKQ